MRKTLPIHMMLLLVLVFLSCLSARAQLWHADLGVLESTEDIIVSASVTYIAVNTIGGNEETPDITEIEESLTEQIENYGWSEWLSIKFLENPGSGQFEIDFALTENTTIADRSFTVGPNGGWITITQEAGEEEETDPDPEPSPEPDSGDDDGWLGPYVPERYRADTSGLRISNDRNWMLTVIPNGGDGKDRYDITYYDGLGYDEQTISIGDSGGDHVTLTGRDAFFRPYKKYLPFPVSGNKGAYVESAETAQDAWYRDAFGLSSASTCAWTETIMEPYADGRVLSEMKPGAEYRERGLSATKDYRFNREGEVLLLGVTDDGGLIVSGHYSPSSLNVTESEDEEGRRTETFTDNEGRTVLVRHFPDVSDRTFTSDTYFAYDIFGQQCWTVLPEGSALLETGQTYPAPPGGFTEASGYEVEKNSFIDIYNGRGLVVRRTIPGADNTYLTYDENDRLCRTQDGQQRADGSWTEYEYDIAYRLRRETLHASDSSEIVLAEYCYDSYDTTPTSLDFRDIIGVTIDAAADTSLVDMRAEGLLTWEKQYVLGSNTYAVRAHYYDYRGRVIQEVESLSGIYLRRTSMRYDLAGNVLMTDEEVTLPDGTVHVMDTDIEYDAQGRPVLGEVTCGPSWVQTEYTYDGRGLLAGRTFSVAEYPMEEELGYTLQGWPESLSVTFNDGEPILGQQLGYGTAWHDGSSDMSGLVSGVTWNRSSDEIDGIGERTVTYAYDGMGRLSDTRQYSGTTLENAYSERDIHYDRNSSLLTMTRSNGSPSDSANVSVSYIGTRGTGGFTYDRSGNMTYDPLTEIGITYNVRNLPETAISAAGDTVRYAWLADGTKLSAVCGNNGTGQHYIGSFVFMDDGDGYPGELDRVKFGDGYLQDWQAYYYVKDYLGSVRAVWNENEGIVEENDYLPYGERFADAMMLQCGNTMLFTGKEIQDLLTPADISAYQIAAVETSAESGISIASTATGSGTPVAIGNDSASSTASRFSLYDSGARFQTTHGMFTSIDPLSAQTPHLSPYAYCAGNPVNFIDPQGLDIWEIDKKGNVEWKEKSDTHQLFARDDKGKRTGESVTIKDRAILDDLTNTHDNGYSFTKVQDSNTDDVFKVFLFAADNTDVEWAVHKNGSTYTLGTEHNENSAGSWQDYNIEDTPEVSLHSHPDPKNNYKTVAGERESMGVNVAQYDNDWNHVISDVNEHGYQTRMSYVYFPKSARLYHIGYYGPQFIRNIKTYKSFYFGTLNNK